MLSCNKKGLAHSNWIVHLELRWCKNRRNPSLSAWSVDMTFNTLALLFLLFLMIVEQLFLLFMILVLIFCSLFSSVDHFSAISTDLVSIFHLCSHSLCLSLLSISSLCTQKHTKYSMSSIITEKTLPGTHYWWRNLVKGEKKKDFPQLPWRGCPFNCSVCLKALCFLIMLGLDTLRHLNQCLMLCRHSVHTSSPRSGHNAKTSEHKLRSPRQGHRGRFLQMDKTVSNPPEI